MRHYGRLRQRSVIRPYPSTALAGGPPPLGRGGFVPDHHSGLHRASRQCTLVGAAIGRPRQQPPNTTRRCKFVKPYRVRIRIGVVLSLASTADERCSPLHTHPPVVAHDSQGTSYASHIDPSRSAIPGTSGLWIGRRFWSLTSPAKGRCPSAHAGAEGLAAWRDAFPIERGHPTLPLHRPCGRSPSPWQGRFYPGLSFRPAPHPPAMHPRRGGHWPSAAGTIKQNTPMQIRTRLGFHGFASACCFLRS